MTDISKYKSVAVDHDCYKKLGKLQTIVLQCVTCKSQGELSSEGREILQLNEKVEELEGKKDFLKGVCKRAGAEIHFLKGQLKDKEPLVLKPEWEVKE